jgi:hypothetical protein
LQGIGFLELIKAKRGAVMDTKRLLLEIYLEYLNDYLTVEKYASDKGITVAQAECILSIGRELFAQN